MQANNNIQQVFTPRAFNLLLAVMAAFIFWLTMYFLASAIGSDSGSGFLRGIHRFVSVWGGEGVSAFVKVSAYIATAYAMLELREKDRVLLRENEGFAEGLLPDQPGQDQMVLSPDEVDDIKLAVINREKRNVFYWVNALIKKTATQYRNDRSVSDTMQVLDAQVAIGKNEQEGQLEVVRYIIQTIPMLGFIGTIVELTASLSLINKPDYMRLVSNAMSSAFDATLVALALTILLTYRYHRHLESLDVFFARAQSYVLDNLVSRIYRQ